MYIYIYKYCLNQFFFGDKARCNFENVAVILSVPPTVFCSAEQSFSTLQRPKTKLRSIMGQDLLSHPPGGF